MAKKIKPDTRGFVYSTDPNFQFEEENVFTETLPAASQKLRVQLDMKRRAGKVVTLITGFQGTEDALQELGKKLKTYCGTGGAAKDAEIIVQGDQRQKVVDWLKKQGYVLTKS